MLRFCTSRAHSDRSAESSLSSNDPPNLDSKASSSDDGNNDDDRTVSTVAMGTDVSSIFDMLHDDPEFASLRPNSVVVSRVSCKQPCTTKKNVMLRQVQFSSSHRSH